ncbi:copper resistance protein CopC [Ilumatobacter nonamiensis]|uniref:copper resistance protein CopC n=1 Tax=Ilumatobacter nonamiensis TaxID=467093 RepID=UPI00130E1005|nr:copper resistance protein CopC [Ilumatobacter nonamiensis]
MRVRGPKLLGAVGVALIVLLAGACGGEEQGGLEGASPGPDARVGGEIDQLILLYDNIVVDADVSVVDPDGTELSAVARLDSDIRVIVELGEELNTPGVHFVQHAVDAVDGDREEGSYSFTFDPSAPAPGLVFPPEDDGSPWLLWIVAVAGVLVIAVLGWQLLQSMAKARARSTPKQQR